MASHSARRFCGRRFVGFGFGLLVFILFSGNGGVVFEPVAPASDGNGLGVMQAAIQDGAGGGHVPQEFAPFLQWPVTGHDSGPVFIPAHDDFKKMLAGVLGQLLQAEIVNYQKFRVEVTAQGSDPAD